LQTSPEILGGNQPRTCLEQTRQQNPELGGDLRSARIDGLRGNWRRGCLS